MALATVTVPESERRGIIETRLGVNSWPQWPLLVTAVDAESGVAPDHYRRAALDRWRCALYNQRRLGGGA